MSVSLTKGQKVNLTKESGGSLRRLNVGLGWDAKRGEVAGAEFDLDASAFLLGANGKVRADADFVFWGNLDSPCGALHHTGDNLTGDGEGDDEVIEVDLAKVPADVEKIVFAVTIYDGVQRKQNFGLVDNSFIRAVNPDSGAELAKYELDMDAALETVVTFGELVKRGADWVFSANSAGFPGGLDGLCRQYGVSIG